MEIYFKKCSESDFEFYYQLKVDIENILWTGHSSPPNKEKLKEWYSKQLERDDRHIFIVKSPDNPTTPVGYLYLDFVGDSQKTIEIAQGVNSKFKGNGIGTRIIEFAIDHTTSHMTSIERIYGWIAENNFGSIKNFTNNNFIESSQTKKVYFKSFNKEVTMRMFYYTIKR